MLLRDRIHHLLLRLASFHGLVPVVLEVSRPIDARAVRNLDSRRHQRLQLGQLALLELRRGGGGNLLAGLGLLLASGRHDLSVA